MIARFNFGRKVRCHNIGVEKIGRGTARAIPVRLVITLRDA
jgi:hypothetical protein